jgi:hypothetical protein
MLVTVGGAQPGIGSDQVVTPVPGTPVSRGDGPGVPALRFAETARRLGGVARAAGLVVPAFRSPPRVAGARRTIRRYPGGTVVSVQLRGRSFDEVASDMLQGVLVANRLEGDAAVRWATMLAEALTVLPGAASPVGPPAAPAATARPGLASPEARMAERQTQAA